MFIKSRQELARLINNQAVESYPVQSKPGRKIMNTIIYDNKKDKFYKVEWGEIANEDQVNFLWYNDNADEVFLNPKNNEGWFTKAEIKNLNFKGGYKMNMEKLLLDVDNNVVNINITDEMNIDVENISVVGARAGKGKTWYAMRKTVEHLIKGDTVLFFSMEETHGELISRMKKLIMETRFAKEICDDFDSKNEETKEMIVNDFIKSADIMIVNSNTMDTNSIILKMKEVNKIKQLDLVLIDSLQVNLESKFRNTVEIQAILDSLEIVSEELKCKVIVTTQLGLNS